jgi:DNA-binding NtrC family response regulator
MLHSDKIIDTCYKVVIASGYSGKDTAKEALTLGAKGFVSKPYDMRQVLEVVRAVLDHKMDPEEGLD